MNDRYKYRVAAKQGAEWLIYDVINILYKPDGTIWVQVSRKTETAIFTAWFQVDGENAILEQCTGLKDKNGKLIYAGDVLNVEDYDGLHTMIVAWYEKASCLSLLKQKAGKYAPIWRHLVAFVSDELEVIGNIHEQGVRK